MRGFGSVLTGSGGGETGAPEVRHNPIPREHYHTDWIADRAIAWLRGLAADDPFFCWVSFPDPHHPFDPPQREVQRRAPDFRDRPLPAGHPGTAAEARRRLAEKPRHWLDWYEGRFQNPEGGPIAFRPGAFTADQLREVDAMIQVENELVDDAVGRIVAALRARGVDEDTDVFYTSDHGELQGDHGLLFKGPYHVTSLLLELLTDQGGKPTGAEERLGPAEVAVTRADRPAVREQFLVARSGVRYLLGKYDESRVDLEAALASRSARLGELAVETAQIRMRLANTLGKAGKTPEAIALLRTELAQYEEALGPEHPKLGHVLDSLAIRVWSAGDYDEARRLGERALSISERALGAEHPQVANALNTLASIAQDQGRTDDQAALNERALAIREKALGAEHPSVANSLSNLAIARRRQGRVDEALALQTRAQAIREKTLGAEHPSIASMLLARATILNEMKRFDEALAAAARALAIRQKGLGPDHSLTGWAHGTVGGVLEGLGRTKEACAEFAKTIDILERASGRDHPDLSAWLGFHVKCLLASRRTRDALDAAERAVAIGEESGRDPMQLADVRFLLGKALWASGGDRTRAVDQVKQAHDAYAAGPASAPEQAKPLAAWLASHRAP